jgi:PilZ domain
MKRASCKLVSAKTVNNTLLFEGALMAEAERRTTRRFSTSLPVALRSATQEFNIRGITRDVSKAGAYVYAETGDFTEGASVELILVLPGEVTLAEAIRVLCKARVVRVNTRQSGGVGVALQIDSYEFLGMA